MLCTLDLRFVGLGVNADFFAVLVIASFAFLAVSAAFPANCSYRSLKD